MNLWCLFMNKLKIKFLLVYLFAIITVGCGLLNKDPSGGIENIDQDGLLKLGVNFDVDPRGFVLPKGYICYRTTSEINIDGILDEDDWLNAPWSKDFVDIYGIESSATAGFRARMKMLWDENNLYISGFLDEKDVWGTLTKRNSSIFQDNAFEVFIDPDGDSHDYIEFQINALNTVWNLVMDQPYKNDGNSKNLEMADQQTGVHVEGTLNKPGDNDDYWTIELSFPFSSIADHANVSVPPADGDQWRMNFSRVQWQHEIVNNEYQRIPRRDGKSHRIIKENYWVWAGQGVRNLHRPEGWGYIQFSIKEVGDKQVEFAGDITAEVRSKLHEILYAQQEYKLNYGFYCDDLNRLLGMDNELLEVFDRDFCISNGIVSVNFTMETVDQGFKAIGEIEVDNGKVTRVNIRHDGKVWIE